MKPLLKPARLGGFRDFLPQDMAFRQELIGKIERVLESFGFMPLGTPALELSSVLGTDQDSFLMQVYRFFAGKRDVTLRFDLTVPLSRVVASNPQLVKPFKRYQCGPVWRKESPQAARYREFWQFDADIVGSSSLLADTEIILLMYRVLSGLNLDFRIRINNRKMLNGLPEVCGFEEKKGSSVLHILDKIEKIGLDRVLENLTAKNEAGPQLDLSSAQGIKDFLLLGQQSGSDLVVELKKFFKNSVIGLEGLAEYVQIASLLEDLGVPRRFWELDLSVARGLGYYTGCVFETALVNLPGIGSVFSGGRYDELISRFTGKKLPAVGASLGLDRLITGMEQLGLVPPRPATTRLLVAATQMDDQQVFALQLAQRARNEGINAEIFLGDNTSLRDQLGYASRLGIAFVVILGMKERQKGEFLVRDMRSHQELLVSGEEDLFSLVKQ